MRRVEEGESFVITRTGHPVADLVPHAAPSSSRSTRRPRSTRRSASCPADVDPRRRPRRMDLRIAATALANDPAPVTRDPDDFSGLAHLLAVVAG